jgi:hypothetical protein
MGDIDELLSQIPIDQVARQLGVDHDTAEAATRAAVPALLGGMEANAQDPAGARSLAGALSQHDDDLLAGGVDLGQVDTADGDKIVSNVFGGKRDQVVDQLGGLGGLGGGKDGGNLMAKLLPILAPIVLSYLAKRMTGRSSSGASTGAGGGLGGLGDILGGMLGGGSASGGGGLGGLGDVLGGLLGGGKR